MNKRLLLLTNIFFLIFGPVLAQKKNIRLNLKEGESYIQVTQSDVNIIQDLNGQKLDINMGIDGQMTYTVKAVTDDNYDMKVIYESLAMEMTTPQGLMKFSSETPSEQDIFSTILAAMKNQPFEVVMSKSGKIIEVRNIENLFTKAFDQFPQLPEAQKSQIKDQLSQSYGEQAFKGNIEMVTAIFPEEPVALNETWTVETKLQSNMEADLTSTYTLAEEGPDYYVIKGEAKIDTPEDADYTEMNGMNMKYDLTGTMDSEIKVDKVTGWIKEAKVSQAIEGTAYVKGNPQMPQDMTIPMNIKSKIIVTDN